jgi:hypothetical protein
MSRQSEWQKKHRKLGLCWLCPRPVYLGGQLCKKHREERLSRQRELTGSKPWKFGQAGRPPIEMVNKIKIDGKIRYLGTK